VIPALLALSFSAASKLVEAATGSLTFDLFLFRHHAFDEFPVLGFVGVLDLATRGIALGELLGAGMTSLVFPLSFVWVSHGYFPFLV
jgi:hypothetical protein